MTQHAQESPENPNGLGENLAVQLQDELSNVNVSPQGNPQPNTYDPAAPQTLTPERRPESQETTPPPDQGGQETPTEDGNKGQSASQEGGSSEEPSGDGGTVGESAATTPPEETPPQTDEPEAAAEPAEPAEPVEDPNAEYYETDDAYFNDLSEKTGYEIQSDEDIVAVIEHLSNANPFEKFSSFLQAAIEYEKNGGNAQDYFDTLVPVDNMTDREIYRQKFNRDNAEKIRINPEFAEQMFQREFNEKFGILESDLTEQDFESPEEYKTYLNNKQFASQELNFEAQAFKESMNKQREEVFANPPGFEQPQGVSPEEQQELQEAYMNDARRFKEDFEAFSIDLGGEKAFNLGLNSESAPIFENWLENPQDFLEHIGISNDQRSIDVNRFAEHLALHAAFAVPGKNSVGAQLAKYISENMAEDTLEKRLEHPRETQGGAPAGSTTPPPPVDEIGEIAEAMARQNGPGPR